MSGNYKVGKDTVGAYLVKQHGFERKAFADIMKKSIARTLDIPYHEIDNLKNDPMAVVIVSVDAQIHRKMTFREFIQHFATEGHRDVLDDNIWVDHLLPVGGYYAARKIVVTDVRFKNEAERIRALDGKVVRVTRPRQLFEQDPHRSEIQSDLGKPDYTLNNNGTMEELFKEVETMLLILATQDKEI